MPEIPLVDTGLECAVQMFVPQALATEAELRAASGRNHYILIDQVATGFHTWEVNVWGFDKSEVEARAALVQAFVESRKAANNA